MNSRGGSGHMAGPVSDSHITHPISLATEEALEAERGELTS